MGSKDSSYHTSRFFVWGYVMNVVYSRKLEKIQHLKKLIEVKKLIEEEADSITPESCQNVFHSFHERKLTMSTHLLRNIIY